MLEDPAQAEQRGQNVVLAGRCLRDVGERGLQRPTWETVIERLVETMQGLEVPARGESFGFAQDRPSRTIRTRAEAGEAIYVAGSVGPPFLESPRYHKNTLLVSTGRKRTHGFWSAGLSPILAWDSACAR